MTITRIDECLTTRDGHLFIEACDTVDLARRFGTPLFAISENQLRRNTRRFQTAFEAAWPDGDVDVLPAIKANWILATRMILSAEGAGADVYSVGELWAALEAGVAPDKISVNGGGKSDTLIEQCLRAGVRITVEDLDEPERIDRIAGRLGRQARIRFRVKPSFPKLWKPTDFAQEKVSIDLGIQTYKSGIPVQYLPALGREVLQKPNLDMVGIHFHAGRHHPSRWYWRGLMQQYARTVADLSREWGGWRPREIDIGGGFALRRDPHNKLGLRRDVVETWLTWPLACLLQLLPPTRRYGLMRRFVGHSCYADRILPFVRVPAVEPGDLVAMLDMGAYQEVSASNFNALPRPATVLVSGSQAEVIRRAETLDDVFRRDIVPERLRVARHANRS